MSEEKPIIMYDAPEAASLKTVTGWVSADGRFFGGDENLARYCGATHRRCEVNPEHPIYEVNSSCDECRHARPQSKFAAMPIKEWAGEPLVVFDGDRYFFDEDSLRDYLIDTDSEATAMSRMEEALMSKPGYTPYCGADGCMVWARTRWGGEQFQCQCGWVGSYPPEFIAEYKARWHPEPKP